MHTSGVLTTPSQQTLKRGSSAFALATLFVCVVVLVVLLSKSQPMSAAGSLTSAVEPTTAPVTSPIRQRDTVAPTSPGAAWSASPSEAPMRRVRRPIQHLVVTPTDRSVYLAPNEQPQRPAGGWPAIVFLHGAGEIDSDLTFLYRALGATGALPQLASLTKAAAHAQPASDPYRWSVAEEALRAYVLVAPLSDRSWRDNSNCDAVVEVIKGLPQQYGVDSRRVFITGVSMGGYGAFRLAARAPQLFAGVIPLCGYGDPEWAAIFRDANLPMLIVHGLNDDVVPYAESLKMYTHCKSAGVKDVTLWTLDPSGDALDSPGNGHAAWRNTYASPQFWQWISNHSGLTERRRNA